MKNIHNAITLIGMPASGKSTVGKILAEKLGWNFIDLDDLIKEKTGKSYDEILEQDGEQALLNLEEKYTLELDFSCAVHSCGRIRIAEGCSPEARCSCVVFSPGGSIIYSPEALEKIKDETRIIYIDLPLSEIEKRLKERPIKDGIVSLKEKGLKKLFEERDLVYRKFADNIIRADNLSDIGLANKILELTKLINQ